MVDLASSWMVTTWAHCLYGHGFAFGEKLLQKIQANAKTQDSLPIR